MTDMTESRRTALRKMGAAGATLLWPSWSLAQKRDVARFSFLVVSDTHLGRGDNESAARRWALTAKALAAADGDLVLHLGDVVDGGRDAQYPVYLQTRKTIGKPVHEIPGNHDPIEGFQKHIRRDVDTAFDHQGVRFVLMNNSRRDSHLGFISDEQIRWLSGQLADAARQDLLLILCMHVPVHTNRPPDRAWYVHPEQGQTALYELIGQHRDRVLALFHGHFHNGVRGWDDHVPLQEVCFPSALYNQDRRLAEKNAPGFYMPEMLPGFVRVSLQTAGMTLSYHPVGDGQPSERTLKLPQLDKK